MPTRSIKVGFAALLVAMALAFARPLPAEEPRAAPGSSLLGERNLIPNGDFELGGDHGPTGWQKIDGLTSFWVKDADPKHGKVLKFDTDVRQDQAYKWWVKIMDGASPKDAPLKIPTVEPKYDTLAGLDGVWYFSDDIPVEKGKSYWFSMDVKGPEMLIWVLGYKDKPDLSFGADEGAILQYYELSKKYGDYPIADPPGEQKRGHKSLIHKYQFKGQVKVGGSNEWKTYSRGEQPIMPTKMTPDVRYLRVILLPLWPPATTYVDNVRLVEFKGEYKKPPKDKVVRKKREPEEAEAE